MMVLQIILLVVILIGALIILGLFLLKMVGKRGCAACGNWSCPMNPGYEGDKKNGDTASRLPDEDKDFKR